MRAAGAVQSSLSGGAGEEGRSEEAGRDRAKQGNRRGAEGEQMDESVDLCCERGRARIPELKRYFPVAIAYRMPCGTWISRPRRIFLCLQTAPWLRSYGPMVSSVFGPERETGSGNMPNLATHFGWLMLFYIESKILYQ